MQTVAKKFCEGKTMKHDHWVQPFIPAPALDDPVKLRRIASLEIYIQTRFPLTYSLSTMPPEFELYNLE